jgi:hypothetical protein
MRPKILAFLFLALIIISCNATIHTSDASYYEATEGNYTAAVAPSEEVRQDSLEEDLLVESYINWENPSFEENAKAAYSTVPIGWEICSRGESPPDIHSNYTRHFEVQKMASQGSNFVGMVVRDNNTFEHLSKKLDTYLEANTDYEFDIDLSLSSRLISLSKTTLKEENFNEPTILRVWGGTSICYKSELLFQTTVIDHEGWQRYRIEFTPQKEAYQVIILEAFYDRESHFYSYNGNLMIDNLSPIRKVR